MDNHCLQNTDSFNLVSLIPQNNARGSKENFPCSTGAKKQDFFPNCRVISLVKPFLNYSLMEKPPSLLLNHSEKNNKEGNELVKLSSCHDVCYTHVFAVYVRTNLHPVIHQLLLLWTNTEYYNTNEPFPLHHSIKKLTNEYIQDVGVLKCMALS